MTTLQSVVQTATQKLQNNSDSPTLDAELLLAFVIGKNRTYLRTWPEQTLTLEQLEHFQALIKQRNEGQPIAYLVGFRGFWSREFLVTPAVLIPRPDTELLIELVLAELPINQHCKILDLGTGSGAIAITLAAERPLTIVTGSDNSQDALAIARVNAERLAIENIQFYQSDWFQQLPDTTYDFIVSNPPYIAPDDPHLSQGDIRFEPQSALIANAQGLHDLSIIADGARTMLKTDGALYLEHGYDQHQQVQAILEKFNYTNIQTQNDLTGHPRVTSARWRY